MATFITVDEVALEKAVKHAAIAVFLCDFNLPAAEKDKLLSDLEEDRNSLGLFGDWVEDHGYCVEVMEWFPDISVQDISCMVSAIAQDTFQSILGVSHEQIELEVEL